MENANYTTLTRQSGLLRELQIIANNIANISTSGYKREGMIFSEYVKKSGPEDSISMARGNTRHLDLKAGAAVKTGSNLDLFIQGDGFFLLSTPSGDRLTRNGAFLISPENTVVNTDGHTLLDDSGNPINLPENTGVVSINSGGLVSSDNQPIANIGIWSPTEPNRMRHIAGTLFEAEDFELIEDPNVQQGFLEDSNVNAVVEIARLIEVQRSYELGQKFMDLEDQRQKSVITILGR